MQVSFNLEPADVTAMRRFLLLKSRSSRLLAILVSAVVVFEFATGDWGAGLGAVASFLAVCAWLLYVHPRRSFRSNMSLNGERTCSLSPDGLSFEIHSTEGKRLMSSDLDWASVTKVQESSDAFLILTMRNVMFLVPKRAFDPSQLATARSLLLK